MQEMTTVVVNDFHGQYRDKETCNMFFNFLRREKPDCIVLAGDIVDFYTLSSFRKSPFVTLTLQGEIDDVLNGILRVIRNAAPQANIYYCEGNHETRLSKYLASEAKEVATLDCLQLEKLLKFKELEIEYIPCTDVEEEVDGIWIGDLFCYHGSVVRQKSGYSAHAELEKNGVSGISGHTHRDSKSAKRDRSGQKCWWENFCMCNLYPAYVTGVANWSQGWSMVTTIGQRPVVEQVAVLGGRYLYRGKEYTK